MFTEFHGPKYIDQLEDMLDPYAVGRVHGLLYQVQADVNKGKQEILNAINKFCFLEGDTLEADLREYIRAKLAEVHSILKGLNSSLEHFIVTRQVLDKERERAKEMQVEAAQRAHPSSGAATEGTDDGESGQSPGSASAEGS